MPGIKIICVGKMKEKFFIDAANEYVKRLGAYGKVEVTELPEQRLPEDPSPALVRAALDSEGEKILAQIPKGACVVALCVEGKAFSSPGLADFMAKKMSGGASAFCFLIGGSFGMAESVKQRADLRLSMSEMTFPHHLARVMLLEQVYRAFKINENSRYHK